MSRNNKSPEKIGNDVYGLVVKFGGLVLAVILWYISMRFSVNGFQIASESDAWIGIIFGILVTYLQLLFNRGAPNMTLYIAGIGAYIYGILTTFVGIVALRNNSFDLSWASEDLLGFVIQLTIVVCIALAVEILPEHLLIHTLRDGNTDGVGDFAGSLMKGLRQFTNETGNHSSKTKNKNNKSNRGQGNRGGGNRPNNVHIEQQQPRAAQPQQQQNRGTHNEQRNN